MHDIQAIIVGALVSVGIGAVVSIGVSLFAKFLPKEKIANDKIIPSANWAAAAMDRLFGQCLKPTDEAKIEEGVIVTLAYWADAWIHSFVAKLNELIATRTGK